MSDNYESFGPEWRQEMMKHTKGELIEMLRQLLKYSREQRRSD